MQKLISDNRLFEFIQKKKRLFEFEMWEDLKSQSKEHVQSQRTCLCELRENFHEAAKSILDMDWLSRMPILTLALINSLCLARFSEDDLDCSTVFDHKSFYAVITRQRIGKNSQIPLIFKIISVLPLGTETRIRTRRRQSLKQFFLFYFYFFMKIKINIYFIFNKILYIK